MSYEDVTPFENPVGVDALMGRLLTVEKAFEMGFFHGYLGVPGDVFLQKRAAPEG